MTLPWDDGTVGVNTPQRQALQALCYKMLSPFSQHAAQLIKLPTSPLECAQWIGTVLQVLQEYRLEVRTELRNLHSQVAELSQKYERLLASTMPPMNPDYAIVQLYFVLHDKAFRAEHMISIDMWRHMRGVREGAFRMAVEEMMMDIVKQQPEYFIETMEQARELFETHQRKLVEAEHILPCQRCNGTGAVAVK